MCRKTSRRTTTFACRCLRLKAAKTAWRRQRAALGLVRVTSWVDGTGQIVPGLLDLVLNLLGGCARGTAATFQSSVSQSLALAVPACNLPSSSSGAAFFVCGEKCEADFVRHCTSTKR
jgi:hypothetical protein